jgi:hypothetical protein
MSSTRVLVYQLSVVNKTPDDLTRGSRPSSSLIKSEPRSALRHIVKWKIYGNLIMFARIQHARESAMFSRANNAGKKSASRTINRRRFGRSKNAKFASMCGGRGECHENYTKK